RRDRVDPGQEHPDHGHHEDAHAPGAAELRSGQDAQPDEGEHEHRYLERQRDPQQHEGHEPVVVARANQDLEVAHDGAPPGKNGGREDEPVGEGDAAEPERGRKENDDRDRPLSVLLERRREEGPELPEHDRQREQESRPERDPDRGRERLDRAEGRRLAEVVWQRSVEPLEQMPVEGVRDHERDSDRGKRNDQARPELAEVFDERGVLAVAKAPREPAHQGIPPYEVEEGGDSSPERCGSSGFFSSPLIESLNSRMPFPSERPISGSRLGPNTSKATIRITMSPAMPISGISPAS